MSEKEWEVRHRFEARNRALDRRFAPHHQSCVGIEDCPVCAEYWELVKRSWDDYTAELKSVWAEQSAARAAELARLSPKWAAESRISSVSREDSPTP